MYAAGESVLPCLLFLGLTGVGGPGAFLFGFILAFLGLLFVDEGMLSVPFSGPSLVVFESGELPNVIGRVERDQML